MSFHVFCLPWDPISHQWCECRQTKLRERQGIHVLVDQPDHGSWSMRSSVSGNVRKWPENVWKLCETLQKTLLQSLRQSLGPFLRALSKPETCYEVLQSKLKLWLYDDGPEFEFSWFSWFGRFRLWWDSSQDDEAHLQGVPYVNDESPQGKPLMKTIKTWCFSTPHSKDTQSY